MLENAASMLLLSLQKLCRCNDRIVQSLATKLLAVAQNIWRLETFWNLDDILSLLNIRQRMRNRCVNGTWPDRHITRMSGCRYRPRYSACSAVMTRRRVEIARQRLTVSVTVERFADQLGRDCVTVALRLVRNEAGTVITGREMDAGKRRCVNSVAELKLFSSAVDNWNISFMCTLLITVTLNINVV